MNVLIETIQDKFEDFYGRKSNYTKYWFDMFITDGCFGVESFYELEKIYKKYIELSEKM